MHVLLIVTHTILHDKKYFSNLTLVPFNVQSISGPIDLIKVDDALYSNKSNQNFLSFKDICRNGYHIETMNHSGNEYLLITGQKQILEQLISFSYGLYQATIRPLESHVVMNQKFDDPKAFLLWHEQLGHPGISMMRRIVQNSNEQKNF